MRALFAALMLSIATPALAQEFQTTTGARDPIRFDRSAAPLKIGPVEGRFAYDPNRAFMTPDGRVETGTLTPELSLKTKRYRFSAEVDVFPRYDREDGISFGIGKPNRNDTTIPLLQDRGPMGSRPSAKIRFGITKTF